MSDAQLQETLEPTFGSAILEKLSTLTDLQYTHTPQYLILTNICEQINVAEWQESEKEIDHMSKLLIAISGYLVNYETLAINYINAILDFKRFNTT